MTLFKCASLRLFVVDIAPPSRRGSRNSISVNRSSSNMCKLNHFNALDIGVFSAKWGISHFNFIIMADLDE